jgi:hypothetical protein
MATISVDIEEIPHGHGLSFKRGVSDGLLDSNEGLDHNSVHPPVMRPAESGRAPLASAVVVGAGAAAAACAR